MGSPTSWTAYRDALLEVLEHGESIQTPQRVDALTKMQISMSYPLSDGFPIITERSLQNFWRKPIGELCAFINGATRVEELVKFGCDWWTPYGESERSAVHGLDPGDLGSGSYGGAFHDFPQPDGGSFDQFANLVEQIKLKPHRRTHFVSPWIPYYMYPEAAMGRKVTVAPCHGWVHVRVIREELHLHLFQRAGDMVTGVPSNMVQYAALLLMLSHLTGYKANSFYHTISDAHIYVDQVPAAREMLSRSVRRLPRLVLNPSGKAVKEIHAFRGEHFDLVDYEPHSALQAPVAL
jgi:thymidylate synthase